MFHRFSDSCDFLKSQHSVCPLSPTETGLSLWWWLRRRSGFGRDFSVVCFYDDVNGKFFFQQLYSRIYIKNECSAWFKVPLDYKKVIGRMGSNTFWLQASVGLGLRLRLIGFGLMLWLVGSELGLGSVTQTSVAQRVCFPNQKAISETSQPVSCELSFTRLSVNFWKISVPRRDTGVRSQLNGVLKTCRSSKITKEIRITLAGGTRNKGGYRRRFSLANASLCRQPSV